jgi:hypothetical protein
MSPKIQKFFFNDSRRLLSDFFEKNGALADRADEHAGLGVSLTGCRFVQSICPW